VQKAVFVFEFFRLAFFYFNFQQRASVKISKSIGFTTALFKHRVCSARAGQRDMMSHFCFMTTE